MAMMRFCPNCQTERSLHEIFCEGTINGELCGWDLSSVTISETGWRPLSVVTAGDVLPESSVNRCVNGHIMAAGDLICMECGADLAEIDSPENMEQVSPNHEEQATESDITTIDDWQLLQRISLTDGVRERYLVKRLNNEKRAVLTLYHVGAEPNIDVYEVLQKLPREHVPEIITKGRWNNQAYVVAEELTGGGLADLGMVVNDMDTIRHIMTELGQALQTFSMVGLRHCDLRPNNLLVRSKEPLDLVITGFGSSRLSEFDLEIISPLATTFYTAPEVLAGGVSVASDWWSLGVILLEQLTQGRCFEGVNTQAFLIQVLAIGVDIPTTLDPRLQSLLRGLLTKEHHKRWQWSEVQAWINGEPVEVPVAQSTTQETDLDESIFLGGRNYHKIKLFALNAANPINWQEATELLSRGHLVTWLEQAAFEVSKLAKIREVLRKHDLTLDMQLMVVLKILNADMPLILVGDIVTPNWLIQHPLEGYQLISGVIPSILKDSEGWLWRLHERANKVRQRAFNLQIKLDEEVLRIHLLSSSRAQLAAIWSEKNTLFHDANNAGLLSLLERRTISEEDLIVLLSAELGQFKSLDTVLKESIRLGERFNLNMAEGEALIAQPRLTLYQRLNERVEGFASTGVEEIDQWVEQYRLEKRISLPRLLVLLSVAPEQYVKPHKRQYTSQIIDFFHKKVTTSILQGPLVRMYLGKYTARVDVSLLGSVISANKLLDHIIQRNNRQQAIDVSAFQANAYIEYQLRNLYRQSNLYRRDTGIDGLYMGFPFLLYQEPNSYRLPRIAPLLLWPIKLNYDMGVRNRITLAFDNEREEIRINPALEGMLGKEVYEECKGVINELLARSALTALEVMDALIPLGRVLSHQLQNLPTVVETERGDVSFACSAVLFEVNFLGQSIGEELNRLKKLSPVNTALETALRLKPYQAVAETPEKPAELERYFTVASDPSQENAVLQARQESGLLIEGPPGTGKSQTIVNMVGDAIGRRKTVLIVCQKKAALEVVYKRLAAEGLDARSVMVNDINADRGSVICSIREQLDLLFKSPKRSDWIEKRKQVAAKITDLENRLDSHHEALHRKDPQTGFSYRELISELIYLNKDYSLFAAPQLRSVISDCDQQQLTALENECAPLVRFWLPACYENSSLIHLKAFSYDLATLDDFKKFFAIFLSAEQLRIDKLSKTSTRFEVDNPKPYQQWIEREAKDFVNISESIRARLVKWMSLFKINSSTSTVLEGDFLISQLIDLQERLALLNESNWCDLSLKLCLLETEVLEDLLTKTRLIVTPAPWYSFLSIKRYKFKRSLLEFLVLQGELPSLERIPTLYNALLLEFEYRPIRQEIQTVCAKLQLPVPDNRANLNIKQVVSEALLGLQEVKAWAEKIIAAPHSEEVEKSLLQSKIAFEFLLNDYHIAFDRYASRKTSLESLFSLINYFEDSAYELCKSTIDKNEVSPLFIIEVNRALPTLEAYQYFRKRVPQLSSKAIMLFERLRFYQADLATFATSELDRYFRQLINYEARSTWKERIEQDNPVLLMNDNELQQQIKNLSIADDEIRALNKILFMHNIPTNELANEREWEDITRLTGQRARRLREFVEQGVPLGLMKLRPVWLMNPDIASRLLPLKAGLFDVVIFDEASQMPVEFALPTLYRGKVAVVSGDEKQMPPSSFFNAQVELEEDSDILSMELTNEEQQEVLEGQWNSKEIMDCPDLLQLARSVLPTTSLQIHYRSAYRELIDYSNAAFYMNQLSIPVRHPLDTIKQAQPIEYIWAEGIYEDQTNLIEAEKVVKVVDRIWQQSKGKRPSIGVVTFNKKQADLIEKLFYEKANQDEGFATTYKQENQRLDHGEDMSIFIKNVENVQGDERDIIVFSTTFGRNEKGIFRRNFGVLGQQGGERRLNVAITRARQKIIIISSMPIEDISDMLSSKHLPITPRDYLQCYLAYAKALSAGNFDYCKDLLGRILGRSQFVTENTMNKRQDAFLNDVEAYIQSLGVKYMRQSSNGVFALDFAIEDPATKLYSIGVECDAPINPLLTHARSRDIWRQSVLKRAIPNILRISSHSWYDHNEQEKRRLKTLVESVLALEVNQ